MSEIPKAYEPQAVEAKWYDFWLMHSCFTADPARVTDQRPAYSIVIPPPNVTGVLHMGHVLNNTIQDILSRKARMDGREVLWLPGTDHAGISTEGMVARQLWKEERKAKKDISREEFLKRVWAWKEKNGDIIIRQLKKLGCSCDWTRERFTMDEAYVACVKKVFVELYRKGLIYRGKRMVNWCPATLTALSDEEVDMEPQKGSLWYFKVEVAEEPGSFLTIATTRPETIPGDTGIAVNPRDPRYARFIGKHVVRPLPPELPLEQKLLPIIADERIDIEFGTGVLKVTPAHDKADFEIGQRHGLPAVDIMNPDATMNDLAGEDLAGLDRFEARAKASELLRAMGSLVKEEPYENKVGFSQRAKVPIEPRLSEQWFLKYPAVEQSRACVEQSGSPNQPERVPDGPAAPAGAEVAFGSQPRALPAAEVPQPSRLAKSPSAGMLRFHPQRWAKVYDYWLSNIQDWCISRQLWWGHRIPVWRHKYLKADLRRSPRLGEAFLPAEQVTWIVENRQFRSSLAEGGYGLSEKQAPTHAGGKYWWRIVAEDEDSIEIEAATESDTAVEFLAQQGFTQDPDVLDTWFSSWLWPFATMHWTGDQSRDSNNPTLQAFYPTTDLVTGPDIIFFWVARMIMAGYEFMGDLPFRNVYFTGIIRDKQGRKMSKTLGNSPDPLQLISKYGADALRFGTMRSAPLGQDVLFDEKDVELGRNFCNKLWNACRFRQMAGGNAEGRMQNAEGGLAEPSAFTLQPSAFPVQGEINPKLLTTDDKWILLKLHQAIGDITTALEEYKFSEATAALYRFFWSEYCDWYVEASKAVLSSGSRGNEAPTEKSEIRNPKSEASRGLPASAPAKHDDARRANTLAVIDFVLSHTLRLFHPFLPFITEELWHGMGYAEDMPEDQGGKTIQTAPWPKSFDEDFRGHYGLDDCYLEMVDAKYDLVTRGRNLRRAANIPASRKVTYVFKPAGHLSAHDAAVLKLLLNAGALDVNPDYQPAKGTPTVRTGLGELWLPLEGLLDLAAEKARLAKELQKIEAEIAKTEQKLANPSFTQKAPPNVLQEHHKRLAEQQAKRDHLRAALESLNSSG